MALLREESAWDTSIEGGTELTDPDKLSWQTAGGAVPARTIRIADIEPSIVGFRSRDVRSRAFNLLRTQLVRLASEGARIIGITSATPRVGKTFVACNVAASLARLPGLSTSLLDLDLRRGSVAERFNIPGDVGLSDYLEGRERELGAIDWGVEDQNLSIFPTFNRDLQSAELLSQPRFGEMIAGFRALPDSIHICDLPPVFANDDTMIIVEHVDAYILVVEDGVTTAKQVRDALRLAGREKFKGTILNRYIRGINSDAYGYGYGQDDYAKYYG
jgi:protein-tyrosine kinase